MPYINKDPIGLSKPEIYSVIAFLQKMSGEPISVKVEDIMETKDEEAVEVAKSQETAAILAGAQVAKTKAH